VGVEETDLLRFKDFSECCNKGREIKFYSVPEYVMIDLIISVYKPIPHPNNKRPGN
jgi:hypothetical protein